MKKSKIQKNDFTRMEKVHGEYNKYVSKDFHFYLSYGARIALLFVGVIVLGILSYICFKDSFSKQSEETLNYEVTKDVKYNLVLFPEDKETTNLSSKIDTISNDLSYIFKTDRAASFNVKYNANVTLVVEDTNTKEVINNPELNTYAVLEEEEKSIKNSNVFKINPNIQLDYDYYNEKAMSFHSDSIKAKLVLTLYLDIETKYEEFAEKVNKKDEIKVVIPLLSDQVSAKYDGELVKNDKFVEKSKPSLKNESMLLSGVALLIVDTMFLLTGISFMFRTVPKKSKYCILRDGLLKEHDSIIVNVRKMPDIKHKNLIDCYSFGELMDAQKILEKPIIYYEIVKDQKCVFFIIGEEEVYEYTLKECDIEF